MILFNQRLLFVHNPKTAGTSLIRFFQETLEPPVFTAGVRELGTFHPHLGLAEAHAARTLGRDQADFEYIVAVARNPFDRERSMHRYFREVLAASPTLDADLPDPLMIEAVRAAARLDFPAFVDWMTASRGGCDLWRSRGFYERHDGEHPARLALLRCEALEQEIDELLPQDLFVQERPIPRLNAGSALAATQEMGQRAATAIAESYDWLLQPGYGASEVRPQGLPAYPRHPDARAEP